MRKIMIRSLLLAAAVLGAASLPLIAQTGTRSIQLTQDPRGLFTVDASNNLNLGRSNVTTTGTVSAGATSPTSIAATGAITSSSPSAGIGYATGAGCAVTQGTNRTTTVVCTGTSGAITLISAAGSATPASFTVTNTSVAATDVVIVNQKSGTDLYEIHVTAVGAGSFRITSFTTGGTTTEQPVFNFAVIKGVAS